MHIVTNSQLVAPDIFSRPFGIQPRLLDKYPANPIPIVSDTSPSPTPPFASTGYFRTNPHHLHPPLPARLAARVAFPLYSVSSSHPAEHHPVLSASAAALSWPADSAPKPTPSRCQTDAADELLHISRCLPANKQAESPFVAARRLLHGRRGVPRAGAATRRCRRTTRQMDVVQEKR